MLRGSQERRWEHRQREERGSGEGRHRDRGRGSHFQGKVRQGREEGSKGKPEEGWRRRGNDQGRIKPPQWLAWGGFVHWCPWFGSSGCAEGGLPGAALGGFESRPISASLTTCPGITSWAAARLRAALEAKLSTVRFTVLCPAGWAPALQGQGAALGTV